MSEPNETERRPGAPVDGQGVLSNLPRTRPQRSSPRRAAARKAMATPGASSAGTAGSDGRSAARLQDSPARDPQGPAGASASSAGRHAQSSPRRTAGEPPTGRRVPRQGFECEGERPSASLQPPGGAELVASAAEVVAELAKAGFSAGERLLKDALSRLPLS